MIWNPKWFPGTNLQDLNLDWILKKISALRGGTTGQYLYKKSNKDFDFGWKTGGGGGGGTSDYLDLDNKPSINNVELTGNKTATDLGLASASDIPVVPVQSVNGKTGVVVLNATDVGAYSMPVAGIPKTDLTGAVQTSLNKADTALQAVPTSYRTAAAQDTIDAAQDAKIETINHRNFLDNWYFISNGGMPVNQRGQTQYSTAGAFIIDRWKLISGTVELTANGLILNGEIQQTIEEVIDQPFTATVLTANGIVSASFNANTKVFSITSNESAAIKAAKLELGSYQTLAHLNGNTWEVNEIPDYASQLAKCQRYLQIITNSGASMPVATGYVPSAGTDIRVFMPLSVPMAYGWPDITLDGTAAVYPPSSSPVTVASVAVVGYTYLNAVAFAATVASSIAQGGGLSLRLSGGSKLIFSCEI